MPVERVRHRTPRTAVRVADAAELRDTGEHVVDALVEEQVRAVERVRRSRRCSRGPHPWRCRARRATCRGTRRPEPAPPARPVSIRISSLAGSELRSPTTIAGNDRGRHSRTNSHSARTCSCRTPLWSSRQLKCAQKTWIGPRGPATSANTRQSLLALVVGRAGTFAREQCVPRAARSASARSPHCPPHAVRRT